jgi:hypothetical protein
MTKKRDSGKSRDEGAAPPPEGAVAPADELRDLLERSIERVLDNVDKHGWSIPFCLAHSHKGERIYVVAESSRPEAEYEPEKHVQSILAQVRRMIQNRELRAVALARNVNVKVSSDQGPVESPAVKVLLDHERGGGSTAYLLYHMVEGRATPDELFYEALGTPFFPPPTPPGEAGA